jgi:serine/threonine-protein kinase
MTPERYQQVEQLYQETLARPAGERAAFLEMACADDEALRREVESLLAAYEQAGSFLETPPDQVAAEMLAAEKARSMAGRMLGHYQVRSLLGTGGMGEIYLAQDLRLGRPVALKLLPAHFTGDADRMRRFVQEAKAASALSHPNVAHIYEIGEAEGVHFIAMEYVQGQTLDARIKDRPPDSAEIVDIAIQVVDALEEAHATGIIHRDIKPANLMITPRGQVKVLDFGLAKRTGRGREALAGDASAPAKTEPGVLMGTVEYMSPEQALGQEVDHRTDIFSLGAVLYEMAAGRRPFAGRTTGETLDRIIHAEPEAVAQVNAHVPTELARIIHKCLEKDRERRYASARELLVDLRNLKREMESGAAAGLVKSPAERRAASTAWRAVAAGLAVLVVAALVYVLFFRGTPGPTQPEIKSLAVLPLKSLSGEASDDYLGLGLTDTLITKLSNIQRLVVRPTSVVRKYTRPDQDPLTAGREQRVDAVLEGSIQRAGERVRVTVRLLNVRDGLPLWAYQYDEPQGTDIFAVQDAISKEVVHALRLRLTSEERARLTKRYTDNTEAYQLYLKGRYYWNKRTEVGVKKAIEYFEQAIEKDSTYALAYSGLADAYTLLAVYSVLPPKKAYPKAKESVEKALAIDDRLAEAYTSLGHIKTQYDWDHSGAETAFRRALELNPNDEMAHFLYALCLGSTGREREAIAEANRAQELFPLSLMINTMAGIVLYWARRDDQAVERLRNSIEMEPNHWSPHYWLGQVYAQKGMYGEALEEARKARELSGDGLFWLTGYVYAVSGEREAARKVIDELKELSKRRYISPYDVAQIYAGLGDKDRVFEWLEKAYEDRSRWLDTLKINPVFDGVRTDARFADFLRRVNLPP